MQSHRPEPVNTFHPAGQFAYPWRGPAIHLLLAIYKRISIYTYGVLIEGHLVLCNSLSKNHSFS